jgi:hypothetical protein
VINLVTK